MNHQVNECVENFEYDLALHYCETALGVAPSNVEVLETTGALLLELGDMRRATEISLLFIVALSVKTFQYVITDNMEYAMGY